MLNLQHQSSKLSFGWGIHKPTRKAILEATGLTRAQLKEKPSWIGGATQADYAMIQYRRYEANALSDIANRKDPEAYKIMVRDKFDRPKWEIPTRWEARRRLNEMGHASKIEKNENNILSKINVLFKKAFL